MTDSLSFMPHSSFSTSPSGSIYESVIKIYESGTIKTSETHVS
jgi:hypothetical protein